MSFRHRLRHPFLYWVLGISGLLTGAFSSVFQNWDGLFLGYTLSICSITVNYALLSRRSPV